MHYSAAPVESVAQQPRQLVELTVPADQHGGAALEGCRQLRLGRGRVQRWILREDRLLQRAQLRAQFRGRLPFVEELAILAAERAGLRVQDLDSETAFRALGAVRSAPT